MDQNTVGKAAQDMNLLSAAQGTSVTTTECLHPVSPGKMLVTGKTTHKYRQSLHTLKSGHCTRRSAAVQLEAMQSDKCAIIYTVQLHLCNSGQCCHRVKGNVESL